MNALSVGNRKQSENVLASRASRAELWLLTLSLHSVEHLSDDVTLADGHGVEMFPHGHGQLLLLHALVLGALGHGRRARTDAGAQDDVGNGVREAGGRAEPVGGAVGQQDRARHLAVVVPINLRAHGSASAWSAFWREWILAIAGGMLEGEESFVGEGAGLTGRVRHVLLRDSLRLRSSRHRWRRQQLRRTRREEGVHRQSQRLCP